jgi:hypothetical protein
MSGGGAVLPGSKSGPAPSPPQPVRPANNAVTNAALEKLE